MSESILPTPSLQARILIVDDHPGAAKTLGRAISQLGPGIEVISAIGGQDAMEQVKDLPVDMLITDMMMPDMNGMELIEKMRSHPAGRPYYTVLMTAYDVPGLKESAHRLKVNEMLTKPFPPEHMRALVQKALEGIKQARPTKAAAKERQNFKILVADDVSHNVTLLSRYLESEGYIFLSAEDGNDALEKIRTEVPDLVLLDVNMPGKDGFEVLKEMRQDPALEHISVIILTAARLDPIDVQTGLNLGADDYMTKPFDRRELLARIRAKLRARETEEAIRRRRREFSMLPEIGRELSARKDLNELAGIILRRSVETLGANVGHILLLQSGKEPLHQEYRLSVPGASAPVKQLPPLGEIQAQLADHPEGVIVADVQSDSFWKSMSDYNCRSIMLVPMVGRLKQVGLVALLHEKAGYFNTDHQLLMRAIASQAAIAVEGLILQHNLTMESQH